MVFQDAAECWACFQVARENFRRQLRPGDRGVSPTRPYYHYTVKYVDEVGHPQPYPRRGHAQFGEAVDVEDEFPGWENAVRQMAELRARAMARARQ